MIVPIDNIINRDLEALIVVYFEVNYTDLFLTIQNFDAVHRQNI